MRNAPNHAKHAQKARPAAPARGFVRAAGLLVLIASACDFYGDPYVGRRQTEPSLGAGASDGAPRAGSSTPSGAATAGSSGAQHTPPALDATASPPPVACGDTLCTPPSDRLASFLSGLRSAGLISTAQPGPAACCLDASAGVCGIHPTSGGACEALPVPDARCPAIDLRRLGPSAYALNRPACCIDEMCGQDTTIIGRGCVENSQVSLLLKTVPFIGSLAKVPAAQRCDEPTPPDPATTPVDAGSAEDGGSASDASASTMGSIPG